MTTVQPRSRQEAKLLGLPDWEIDQMFPAGNGLLGTLAGRKTGEPNSLFSVPQDTQQSIDAYAAMPQTLGGPTVDDLAGAEPSRPDGYWQGGDKFTFRDGLAGILAAVGDGLTRHNGGSGGAVDMLSTSRQKGRGDYETSLKNYVRNKQIAALPNMTPREFAAFSMDPKAWGGHMSDALSTHHAAANVNPGEQRVFGNPNMGASVYQAPTSAEQYASAMGEVAQTPGFRTALQDYVLRGSGPTAFDYDTRLDGIRTDNDMSIENLRQRNRTSLRGVPTYRDLNPPAPRAGGSNQPRRKSVPTATGPNGEKLQFVGGKWVPLR